MYLFTNGLFYSMLCQRKERLPAKDIQWETQKYEKSDLKGVKLLWAAKSWLPTLHDRPIRPHMIIRSFLKILQFDILPHTSPLGSLLELLYQWCGVQHIGLSKQEPLQMILPSLHRRIGVSHVSQGKIYSTNDSRAKYLDYRLRINALR